jgi:hypothetical protein
VEASFEKRNADSFDYTKTNQMFEVLILLSIQVEVIVISISYYVMVIVIG